MEGATITLSEINFNFGHINFMDGNNMNFINLYTFQGRGAVNLLGEYNSGHTLYFGGIFKKYPIPRGEKSMTFMDFGMFLLHDQTVLSCTISSQFLYRYTFMLPDYR